MPIEQPDFFDELPAVDGEPSLPSPISDPELPEPVQERALPENSFSKDVNCQYCQDASRSCMYCGGKYFNSEL